MMQTKGKEKEITVKPDSRIDAENAKDTEELLNKALASGTFDRLIIDADDLTYISSAGLRAILKVKKRHDVDVDIINASAEVYDIFDVTGFSEIFHVKRKPRSLSVEGCEVIGEGFYGKVYRIDDETIVKVYQSADALTMIENEQKMAKRALICGIPTAISYDIVRVGEGYGSVFEMIKSKTFNDMIREEPQRADEIIRKYIDFIKVVHNTDMGDSDLPTAKSNFYTFTDALGDYLESSVHKRLYELIDLIPDSRYAVHGDIQMKNVMMSDGEPLLIDMETLGTGNCVFDLQGLYVTYQQFKKDDPNNTMEFLGISSEMADRIWDTIISEYYDKEDEDLLPARINVIRLLADIRFLSLIVGSSLKDSPLGQLRIKNTKADITKLLQEIKEEDFDKL